MRAALVESFNTGFFDAEKAQYDNGVMTTFTLPLHLNVVPDENKNAVEQGLLKAVTAAKNHNTCGMSS